MHLPAAFAERDLASLDRLAEAHDFAILTTVVGGEPLASHVPVLYRRDGDVVEISGHLARPNPQSRQADRGLLILHGPHAYVSAGWYPDKEQMARVPTWNYVAAHLRGRIEWFDDEDRLADLVGRLSARHEDRIGGSWRFDADNPRERSQLRGIVGFTLRADDIALQRKLSQNHPQANREAVASHLAASSDHNAQAIARLMGALPRIPQET